MNRLVIDTETTNGFSGPRVYDFGGLVINHKGEEVDKFDFVIEEIFYDTSLMRNAYYKDKLPRYYDEIEAGIRKVVTFEQARNTFLNMIKKYNISKVYAYNAHFDINALDKTTQLILHRDFLPAACKIEWCCIMGAALSTICTRRRYVEQAARTPKGNVSISAENVYRYLTKDESFEEAHTGLQDAYIEAFILMCCLACHKKMNTKPQSLQCFGEYWELQKRARKIKKSPCY